MTMIVRAEFVIGDDVVGAKIRVDNHPSIWEVNWPNATRHMTKAIQRELHRHMRNE